MDLQYALLLIGIIIVVTVALSAYDKGRIGRPFRRRSTESSPSRPESIARIATRLEPTMHLDAHAAAPREIDKKFLTPELSAPVLTALAPDSAIRADDGAISHRVRQELQHLEVTAAMPLNLNPGFDRPGTGPEAAALDPTRQILPDEKIDFVMHLPGPGPVRRRTALGTYKQHEFELDHPRQLYGQRYHTNFWSVVQHDSEGTQYSDLKIAIQLVDGKGGALNETELNAFIQVGIKLADHLHRPAKFSIPFEQALERAKEVQEFCQSYDVIAGINIVSDAGRAFGGPTIVAAAQKLGLQFGATNIFHMNSAGPNGFSRLFSLTNQYQPGNFDPEHWDDFTTKGLTLFMSVPCAIDPGTVFDQMVATGRGLCQALGGHLFDQDRRPLSDSGVARIHAQIKTIATNMTAFGVVPGGPAALRLFGNGLG